MSGENRLIGTITLLAFFVRLMPLIASGSLGGFRGYDDGVHYAAGVNLLVGSLPYRDYVLVHPPGIALLMLPFAVLGHLVSDTAGVGAARILFAGFGALNTMLIGILLKKWGAAAVISGAGLYSVWAVATIAERSIMLSPLLNTCVLAALLALRSSQEHRRRAVMVAAAFLGLALCFKLWALLPVLVIGLMVVTRFGFTLLLRFATVVASVCILIMGPFFAMAPTRMFMDVIMAQVARSDGEAKGIMSRLYDFAVLDPVQGTVLATAALGLLCVVTAAISGLARSRNPRNWTDEFWWALLAAVIVAALLMSASFFDHYPNFAAPSLALCLGVTVGSGVAALSGLQRPLEIKSWRTRATGRLVAVAVSMLLLIPVAERGLVVEPKPPQGANEASLAAAVTSYDCVFSTYAYMGIMSDSISRSMQHGCGAIVDVFGTQMVEDLRSNWHGTSLPVIQSVQTLQLSQLNRAQAAMVGIPHAYYGLTDGAIDLLYAHFRLTATSGNFEIWVRR